MGRRDIYCLRRNQKTFKWSPENGDNIKFWRYIKHYRGENIFCWWFLINQDNINIIGLKIISLMVKGKSINTAPQVSGHLWHKRTQRHQHQGKQSQRQQQGGLHLLYPCRHSCGGQMVTSWILNTSPVPILCSTLRSEVFGMTSRGQLVLYKDGRKRGSR